MAFELVRRVVAARAVRRAHEQIDFLLVEDVAVDLQADVAHDDDTPLAARHVHRQIDHGVGFRRRRHDGLVGAVAARDVADQSPERVGIARPVPHAERLRARDATAIEIETDHVAPGSTQQLRRDLADHPEAEHADALAELRRGAADALHGDRAERRRCRDLRVAARRHAADEIARHVDVVGVVGLPGAGARDQVAGGEIGDAVANGHDFAGSRISNRPPLDIAVAGGHRGLRSDGGRNRQSPQLPARDPHDPVHRLARIAGAGAREMAHPRPVREAALDGGRIGRGDDCGSQRRDLGANADGRIVNAHEDAAARYDGTRHTRDDGAARVQKNLPHQIRAAKN